MKQVTVSVTEENINRACRKNAHLCMIAMSLIEQRPMARHVVVDIQSVKFTENGVRYEYFTPVKAQQAIIDFDNGRPVQPFTIELKTGAEKPAGQNVPRTNPRNKGTKRTYKRLRASAFREFGRRKFAQVIVNPQQ